jgi:hypothetical protein
MIVVALGLGIWGGLMMGGLRELRSISALRADPIDLLNMTDRITASDSDFLLLGDSRVAQWAPVPEIGSDEFELVGSSGMTAIQMELVTRLLGSRLAGKTVVVQIGINDLKSIGYMDRSSEEIISETKRALAAIHRTLKKNEVRVFVSTILPPGPINLARRPIWSDEIRDAVVSVNEALLLGHLMPVESVIDFGDSLGTLRMTDSKFSIDSLHLNQSGYTVLDLFLIERLSQVDRMKDAF